MKIILYCRVLQFLSQYMYSYPIATVSALLVLSAPNEVLKK